MSRFSVSFDLNIPAFEEQADILAGTIVSTSSAYSESLICTMVIAIVFGKDEQTIPPVQGEIHAVL